MQRAAELLREANGKYNAKDLMGALKLYEDVLNQVRRAAQLSWALLAWHSSCRRWGSRTLQYNILAGLLACPMSNICSVSLLQSGPV
jgi:hypothetical protein